MNKKPGFAVLAIAFIFGLILNGCANSKEGSAAPAVKGVQVYTLSGWPRTFKEYTAPVTTLTVTGILIEELGNNPNSIGNIGSISADGKLTLNLPSVEDGKLFQIGGDDDIPEELKGFRYGMLVTTPALSLVNSNGDESLQLFYANKTPPLQELLAPFFRNMPKGWSYLGNRGIVTDLSSYKWVIKTGGQ